MGDDAGRDAPEKFFERKRARDSGTRSEKTEPKKRQILQGLCEQCNKIKKPGTTTFKEITKADVVMLTSAKEGHLNCVEACLAKGTDVNQLVPVDKNNRGDLNGNYIEKKGRGLYKWKATALMKAAENGHHECLSLLVELGADVNLSDGKGPSALFFASCAGHAKSVKLLIEAGADVNMSGCSTSPLNVAARSSNFSPECIRALLEAGADVNKSNSCGETVHY